MAHTSVRHRDRKSWLTFNDLSDRSFKSSFDYTHRQAAKLAKKMG